MRARVPSVIGGAMEADSVKAFAIKQMHTVMMYEFMMNSIIKRVNRGVPKIRKYNMKRKAKKRG